MPEPNRKQDYLTQLDESIREKIKVEIPKKQDVEEIVLKYNEIQLTDLGSDQFFKNL